MDFLSCELVVPHQRAPSANRKSPDLIEEDKEFKAFLIRQRGLIHQMRLVKKNSTITKNQVTMKIVKEILESLYSIRNNNYFIFYFGNNQFGKCFILNWFEIVLKSDISFQEIKTALNTLSLMLRTSKNLNITDNCHTITSQCKCLPDWSIKAYKDFFKNILFDVHSMVLLLQGDLFLVEYNDAEFTLTIFDLINYLVYFLPLSSLLKTNFINDSIDFMLKYTDELQAHFLNTLNLIISIIYSKEDTPQLENELINEMAYAKLIESLNKSLICLLKSSSTKSSNEFKLKLLNIVFNFCIHIDNSVTDLQGCRRALQELYDISVKLFENFLNILSDHLKSNTLDLLHINLLMSYVNFLTPLLNNQLAAGNENQLKNLILILVNVLQLAKEHMLQSNLNHAEQSIGIVSLSLKLKSIVFFKKRIELKRLAQRMLELKTDEEKIHMLFATDHVLNEIKHVLRIFQESKVNYESEKVLAMICDLTNLLRLIEL